MNETGVALILLIMLCGCLEYPKDTEYQDDTEYLLTEYLLEEEDYEVTPTTTQKTPAPAEKTVKQPEPPCSTLKDEKKDTCLYGLVIKNNDIRLCDKIQGHITQSMCLAAAKKDPDICKLIKDKLQRDDCYKGVALTKKDHRICEDINTQSIKNSCYYNLAKETKDYSLCNKITGSLKDMCIKCSLKPVSVDKKGTVKSDKDTVGITAVAKNCKNLYLGSYGDPEYLTYVSKSTRYISSNNKEVWIKYRCHDTGERIPLKLAIANQELTEYVECNPAPKKKCSLTLLPSDTKGTVKSDKDTITIKARAKNCRKLAFNPHITTKYIEYVDKSHRYIPSDDKTIWVKYKCRFTDTEIPIKLEVGEVSVTEYATCKSRG